MNLSNRAIAYAFIAILLFLIIVCNASTIEQPPQDAKTVEPTDYMSGGTNLNF